MESTRSGLAIVRAAVLIRARHAHVSDKCETHPYLDGENPLRGLLSRVGICYRRFEGQLVIICETCFFATLEFSRRPAYCRSTRKTPVEWNFSSDSAIRGRAVDRCLSEFANLSDSIVETIHRKSATEPFVATTV